MCSEIMYFNMYDARSLKSLYIWVQMSYTTNQTQQNRNYTILLWNLHCNECTVYTVPLVYVLHCQHKLVHLASRPLTHPVAPKIMFFYWTRSSLSGTLRIPHFLSNINYRYVTTGTGEKERPAVQMPQVAESMGRQNGSKN